MRYPGRWKEVGKKYNGEEWNVINDLMEKRRLGKTEYDLKVSD